MKISLQKLKHIVHGTLVGDPSYIISGVAPFESAQKQHITFIDNSKLLKQIHLSKAGAVVVPKTFTGYKKNLIKVSNPKIAFIQIMKLFSPKERKEISNKDFLVDKSTQIDSSTHVSSMVHIGKCVKIGKNSIINPGVFIGDNVTIKNNTVIHPNVTIMDNCFVGNNVIIHSGSVIGSDGFGFVHNGEYYHKMPHIGIVQIDDNVEIGACNTIDRATMGKTWIKSGVKTDNIVHIGHNVTVGKNTLIIANVAIAGSTVIGNNVILAGKVGVSGHLNIGDNVKIGPRSGIFKNIAEGEIVSGSPSMRHKKWLRVQQILKNLPNINKVIKRLEKKIKALENK